MVNKEVWWEGMDIYIILIVVMVSDRYFKTYIVYFKVVHFILNLLYLNEAIKNCVDASKHVPKGKFLPLMQKRRSWKFKVW